MKNKPRPPSRPKKKYDPPHRHSRRDGRLIIIGGAEKKEDGGGAILKLVAESVGDGRLVVITAASSIPDEMWDVYRKVFRGLGIKKMSHLKVEQPADGHLEDRRRLFDDATAVFFTGGDQLKITTKLGGTPVADRIRDIFNSGGLLAGTSAGASVMGELMLIGGENTESHKVGNWMMAPGMRFVKNMIIDQHFAQRGRIGRLLGAVALNPGVLGIGIDEDTAVIVQGHKFKVLGRNAVYVVDGTHVSYTNISEASADKTMSMHDVRLHILTENEVFDFFTRTPEPHDESGVRPS
jgi:cyanophycinase